MSVLKRCLSYIESQIKGVIKAGTQPGFSLIFKVDSYDIKEGGLVTECCRQFQAFTLSLYPRFPLKVDGSNLHVAGFLAGCRHLMKTLGTSYRCSFYQGVCLIEVAIKRVDCHVMWVKSKGVKISIFTRAFAWHYLKWNFETSSWTLLFHSCSKWKVCARAKANRTDILQSKCSMIKQYGWTVQALDLLPSSSRPALDHRSEILFQRSLEFKFLTTAGPWVQHWYHHIWRPSCKKLQ